MNNNLQTTLKIQFDIFKHEQKEWKKIIIVNKIVMSNNLQATLFIQFDVFKHE